MRILLVGAGQVGTAVVEALHRDHDLAVVDLDGARLSHLGGRYDLRTVTGRGTSREVLLDAGAADAELVIASTDRDEVNIVVGLLAKSLAPQCRTMVRTTDLEYVTLWQERLIDADLVVSAQLEAAIAVGRTIGVPAARQTDVFADGQVQVVELDVDVSDEEAGAVVGRPLREARLPADSKVVGIVRGDTFVIPGGDDVLLRGDRLVVIGSPEAARAWSRLMVRGRRRVERTVVFGAGEYGVAIARALLDEGVDVALVEPVEARARRVAEELPDTRVFHSEGFDPELFRGERLLEGSAAVFATGDDARNHFGATLAKLHGAALTVALVHDAGSFVVFERSQEVDVPINPRSLTAEEIVRFARDPRTRQVVMLEDDRFEVLDIVVRPESRLVGKRLQELSPKRSLIGALVRDGTAIFPHGNDMLQPGDRAIVFTEASRAKDVERAL